MSKLSRPLVCPVMVGRDEECAGLESLLGDDSEVPAILIHGEAGIGKSRLLRWLTSNATDRGWVVADGHCYEQDRSLAFAGLADTLRRAVEMAGGRREEVLGPLANTLAAQLPGLVVAAPAAPRDDPEIEKRRLFDGTTGALTALARGRPLLIALEDLHWGDEATLEWIAFLARSLRGQRVVVAATYRSEASSPALAHLLGILERERLAAEVRLEPLDPDGVEEMVRAILGRHVVRSRLVSALHRRTQGIPFLVEELLRSALADDAAPLTDGAAIEEARIPASIREAVTARLETLTEDARAVVVVAAVLGDAFRVPLLASVTGMDRGRLVAALRELVREQLLREVNSGEFRFQHALTREVVGERLLATERRVLHARIAEALLDREQTSGEEAAEQLAHHLYGAEEWEAAVRYGLRAGQRALRLYAPATAREHLDRARAAARHAHREPPPALVLAQAQAHEAIGDFEGARAAFEEAVTLAERLRDSAALIDGLIGLGLLWGARDYGRMREYLDRAVDTARALGDPLRLARALARLGNWHSNAGSYETSRVLLEEALDVGRTAADQRVVTETVDLLGMACLHGGRFDESLGYFREAAEGFRALGDPRRTASPLSTITVLAGSYQTAMVPPALTLAEAIEDGEAGLAIARSTGDPVCISYALWQLSFAVGPSGRPATARLLAEESRRLAEDAGHRQWALAARCALAAVDIDLLRPRSAVEDLDAAIEEAEALGSDIWLHQVALLTGDALIALGRHEEAATLLARVRKHEPQVRAHGVERFGLTTAWDHALEVDLALARHEPEQALALVGHPALGSPGLRLRHARVRALLALQRPEEARAEAEAGLEAAHAHGNRSLEWRLLADLAASRLAIGERPGARAAGTASLEVISRIAEDLTPAEAEDFRRSAEEHVPVAARTRVGHEGPLSVRELEVARLVARGLTNRAIADELVVSIRTVESHVANAMSRLNLPSRSALAVWVSGHQPPEPQRTEHQSAS